MFESGSEDESGSGSNGGDEMMDEDELDEMESSIASNAILQFFQ
jgi:hypothetical protein